MHTLLTIDRKGSLVPGQSITLTQPDYTKLLEADITLTTSIADTGFPDRLSRHGQRYLLNWSMKPKYKLHEDQEDRYLIYATPSIEAIFEF